MSRSWDVFCKVVDNFGDAAVCWRLAQQLALEHAGRVRLFIDDAAPLAALCPGVAPALETQQVHGVEVRRWYAGTSVGTPADVAVDAFGCGLPEAYAEAMAARTPRSLWIVLEYLSAESWVAGHHGLPSPHPRLPLERYFFFPGVAHGTGGVLHEAGLEARRTAFDPGSFWTGLGFGVPDPGATVVSLFGYENPAVVPLLDAWADGPDPVVLAVTDSRIRAGVTDHLGIAMAAPGTSVQRGRLEARFLPFLPQPAYDELLWACDWNFVRGEDSFVRAQWARRPLAWHIYPQADGVHLGKLEAFLEVYCDGLDPRLAAAMKGLWSAWNRPGEGVATDPAAAWAVLASGRTVLRAHAEAWAAKLAAPGDLAANLADFARKYRPERLK